MNVYVREVASALAQAGVECTTYTRADRPGCRRGARSSRATGSCTCRPGRSTCPRRRWPTSSTRSPPASLDARPRRRRRRRRPRQLLAERRRRPPPEARARRAARVDVPHARPGQGRGRRPGAGVARPGRGRGHRLQRRHLRQLSRGGAPVPPALRRPGRAHRDRAARRRARLLRARRPAGARRAVGLPDDGPIVLFVGRIQPLKAPDVAIRAARRAAPPRRRAGDRRRRQRRRRRRRGGARPPPGRRARRRRARPVRRRRSRTTSCPATTAPPTW